MMDIEQMRAEVRSIPLDTNVEQRRSRYNVALISTMLDVAESLRVLAAESAAAMQGVNLPAPTWKEEPGDEIGIGSIVYAEHIDGPGEVKGFGQTEGKALAVVDFGGNEMKVWLDDLHLLTGDEGTEPDPLAEVIIDLDEVSEPTDLDGNVIAQQGETNEPDVDADFAADPLEVVKRKAAARKKKGSEK